MKLLLVCVLHNLSFDFMVWLSGYLWPLYLLLWYGYVILLLYVCLQNMIECFIEYICTFYMFGILSSIYW